MQAYFTEVLARETASLAGVHDRERLAEWRQGLVDQAMACRSPYAQALRHDGDPQDRATFVDRWGELIAATLERITRSRAQVRAEINTRQAATSIIAALYGGSLLSRVSEDAAPLQASLNIALAPFFAPPDEAATEAGTTSTAATMEAC